MTMQLNLETDMFNPMKVELKTKRANVYNFKNVTNITETEHLLSITFNEFDAETKAFSPKTIAVNFDIVKSFSIKYQDISEGGEQCKDSNTLI